VVGVVGCLDHSVAVRGGLQTSQHRGERDRRCLISREHVVGSIWPDDEIALGPGDLDRIPNASRRRPTPGRCHDLRVMAVVKHHDVQRSGVWIRVVDGIGAQRIVRVQPQN